VIVSNCEQARTTLAFILKLYRQSRQQLEAAQVFVVSLAWTRPKRNDCQAGHASQLPDFRLSSRNERKMTMLILIIILVLVLGGGGGYYGHSRWGYGGGAGIGLGTILLILLVAYMLGVFH